GTEPWNRAPRIVWSGSVGTVLPQLKPRTERDCGAGPLHVARRMVIFIASTHVLASRGGKGSHEHSPSQTPLCLGVPHLGGRGVRRAGRRLRGQQDGYRDTRLLIGGWRCCSSSRPH